MLNKAASADDVRPDRERGAWDPDTREPVGPPRDPAPAPITRTSSASETFRDGGTMRRIESLEQLGDLAGRPQKMPLSAEQAVLLKQAVMQDVMLSSGAEETDAAGLDDAARAAAAEGGKSSSAGPPSSGAPESYATYNPKPHLEPPPQDVTGTHGDRVVIVMVGLPARGKTFIARKVAAYLSFFHGAPVRTFNVGEYRRKLGTLHNHTSDYFADDNELASAERESFAQAAMADMKEWLRKDMSLGRVGIFDGTNTNANTAVAPWFQINHALLRFTCIFYARIVTDEP